MRVRDNGIILLVVAMLVVAPVCSAVGPEVEGGAGWWSSVEAWLWGLAGGWSEPGGPATASIGSTLDGGSDNLEPPAGEPGGRTDQDGASAETPEGELGPWTDPNG